MGSSKSKFSVLSYEEAEKRLSDKELTRLKRAFNQLAPKGTLNLNRFHCDVFEEFLPFSICEVIFNTLKIGSSSNGITFKELLIGIIILTGGSYDEKCRFIYSLYCNELGTGIDYATLQGAVDDTSNINDLHMVSRLLDENVTLSFDNFMKWIGECPKFNEITYWLLLLGCPENIFTETNLVQDIYQLIAGITHLEEAEIIELEKTYHRCVTNFPKRYINIEGFSQLVSPPLPPNIVEKVFQIFDENNDGNVDLKELACGISACTRGPTIERKKFCCKIFDDDKDGRLQSDDIEFIFNLCNEIKIEETTTSLVSNCKAEKADGISYYEIMNLILSSNEMTTHKSISIDDFLIWMNDYDFIEPLLELLNQICTVTFSVKPQSSLEEEQIITKWLKREEKAKSIEYDGFYLINRSWLKMWLSYTRNITKEKNIKSISKDSISGSKFPYSKSMNNVLPLSRRHQYDLTKINKFPVRGKSSEEVVGKYTFHNSINDGGYTFDLIYPDFSFRGDFASLNGSNNSLSSLVSSTSFQDVTPSNKLLPINNNCLLTTRNVPIYPNTMIYTDDGGIVDSGLKLGEDFDILPAPIWNCLKAWYGGGPSIYRPVFIEDRIKDVKNSKFDENCIILNRNQTVLKVEIQLLTLFIMRHVTTGSAITSFNKLDLPAIAMVTESVFTSSISNNNGPTLRNLTTPKRQICGRASFSRQSVLNKMIEFLALKLNINKDEMRLWKFIDENNLILLENEDKPLQNLDLQNYDKILVELRNLDLTWPEELIQLAKIRSLQNKKASSFKGITGLSNIGNTCFFNSALQCTSNTNILTDYFIRDIHLYELNRTNTRGCQGMVALRYAELIKDIWAGSSNLIVPLKLKITIERYAHQFSGNQQHDAQEFLSALLDSLHEDLNRVKTKPSYKELKDSDGRSDKEVADEAWKSHIESNQSIIVDLFHGLLRSNVCCDICKNNSVRFDAYSMLSLPIPMQTSREIDILVFHKEFSIPQKHCVVILSLEVSSSVIREQLAEQLTVTPQCILLAFIEENKIKKFINSEDKILIAQTVYAYIICDDNMEDSSIDSLGDHFKDTVIFVIYHRKMVQRAYYLLEYSKYVREIFSYPIVFVIKKSMMNSLTYKNIYEKILTTINNLNGIKCFIQNVQGLIKPLHHTYNHAVDCDSVDDIQPFKLSSIRPNGKQCSQCHWSRFCSGCPLTCSNDIFEPQSTEINLQYLAIDWSPAAFHLRFNSENEKTFIYNSHYKDIKLKNNQSMDLLKCIEIFTTEETLGKDTLYQCTKCKKPQPAHKKLDFWTLPPILIVHLKRFQFVDNRWQKANKIVHYPLTNLNLQSFIKRSASDDKGIDSPNQTFVKNDSTHMYNLYAVNCHLGSLQMGHYITYARNKETGKWYMYNDSICKEVNEKDVNTNSAYLLFYERANVDFEQILDELEEKKAPVEEVVDIMSDEVDTDIKRYCVIQ